MSAISQLVSIASPALGSPIQALRDPGAARVRGVEHIAPVLEARNGFYAFESALHVFPTGLDPQGYGLGQWNSAELWRFEYGDMADDHLFFAEDAFGGQFSVFEGEVYSFDPETGSSTKICSSIEDWAAMILDDHRVLTGWPLVHEWQREHGALPIGKRLLPTVPFVFGGEFSVGNLRAVDAVEAMRVRGHVAQQIRDLPDGQAVQIRVVD